MHVKHCCRWWSTTHRRQALRKMWPRRLKKVAEMRLWWVQTCPSRRTLRGAVFTGKSGAENGSFCSPLWELREGCVGSHSEQEIKMQPFVDLVDTTDAASACLSDFQKMLLLLACSNIYKIATPFSIRGQSSETDLPQRPQSCP